MALSARDLYFAVRVEDRATRPLRRIAADMRAMGRAGLSTRRGDVSSANLAMRRAESARRMAAQQFLMTRQSIASGKLASATQLEQARAIQRASDKLRLQSGAWRLSKMRATEATNALRAYPVERLQLIGRAAGHAGRALTFMGAAATAALLFSAKAAADFSTQVTVAATQSTTAGRNSVKAVQQNATMIQAAIQKMLAGGKVIAGPEEQTSAVYRIFSGLSFKGGQLSQLRQGIQLLREFNRVTTANVGLVTLEESTKAGIILINRFGLNAKEVRPALNTMQAAVRFGDMTMSEFIGTLNQMAPASQAAGYNITQMSAAAAFLSRQFPSLRQGATGYARLIEVFARKDIIEGLRARNVEITKSVNGVQKLIPINEIARRIIDKFGGSVQQGSVFLQNFFKEIGNTQATSQARRALEPYLHRLDLADEILKRVRNDHQELQKSLDAAQQAPGVRWMEFTNQLKALTLEIGTGVIPAITYLIGYVRGIATWVNQLSPSTKQMVGQFALFTAVGVTLGGILATIVGGLISLRIVAKAIVGAGGFGLMATEVGSARIQFAILLAVVVALTAAIKQFPGFRSALGDNIGPITKTLGLLISMRFAVLLLSKAFGVAALSAMRFGAVGLAGTIVGLGGLLGPLALTAGGLLTLQIALEIFKNEMMKTVQYYDIVNGKTTRASAKFEKEAKAVGAATAAYNGYLRAAGQVGSFGPGGPIVPGGGITLHPARGSVTDRGDSPGFGFGKTVPDAVRNMREARNAARGYGVDASRSFTQAYIAYKKAAEYVDAHPTDWRGLERKSQAAARLESVVGKQRAAAMKQAFTAELRNNVDGKKLSDARILTEARNVQRLERIAKQQKTFSAWKTYYKALGKLQKDASDSQLQAAQQMFDTTDKKAKDAAKKVDQTARKMREKYQQVLQNVQSQYQTFYSQNQNLFGQLFQGPYTQSAVVQDRLQFGAGQIANLNKNDILKDLRSQVTRFTGIQRTIGRLRGRGLPATLLQQIETLGPEEAQKMLGLINRMTPAQIKEYSRLWRQGQKEVHDATMRDVKSQLKEWRRHGRRIGLAIAAGLRDENTVLEKSLRGLITQMFPELAGKNQKTPARTTPGRVRSTGTQAKPKGGDQHTHYHVAAAPHDSHATIKKQLDDANWHHRTRQK